MITFIRDVGLDGADLAVRPGYPVHPGNMAAALPEAAKAFGAASLLIPLVTAPTDLVDPSSELAEDFFAAAGASRVQAIKIGYFRFSGRYQEDLDRARRAMAGFAKLAEKHAVRACYHTHSGAYIGSNAVGVRALLAGLDPHHVGAFLDTGHQAVGGAPIEMAVHAIAEYLALLSIKDMVWTRDDQGRWRREVSPASTGIVDWAGLAKALKQVHFDGPVSVHAEYHLETMDERRKTVAEETKFLRTLFGMS